MATVIATAQDMLDRAIERSSLNNPDLIATDESLAYITRYERAAFLKAARLNPNYFGLDGTTNVRAAYTDDWDLEYAPGGVAALTKLEVTAITGTVTGVAVGDEVHMVDITYPEADVSPRVYVRNRVVHSYGTELGAATANMVTQLTVFYSPLSAKIMLLTQPMALPEEFDALIWLPLARVFSIRDRRLDELEGIKMELDEAWASFQEAVLAMGHGTTRSLIDTPAIPLVQGQR